MIVAATGAAAGSGTAASSITFQSNPSEYIVIISEPRIISVDPQNQLIFRSQE